MTSRRRIQKLAVLVDVTPDTLADVVEDVLHETVNELQTYKPSACRRIVRGIHRHQRGNSVAGKGA